MATSHTVGTHTPDLRTDTLRAIQQAGTVLRSVGLTDVRDRMVAHTQCALTPGVVVAVVGGPRSGKTALVNGVVGAPLLTVDERFRTTIPTILRDTAAPELAVRQLVDGQVQTIAVATSGLPSISTSFANEGNRLQVFRAEVGTPSPVLAKGFVLLDTPSETLATKGASRASALASVVDALVLCVPADRAIAPGELALVRRARERGTAVVVALTKLDAVESVSSAVEGTRAALASNDLDVAVVGTSYAWRLLAASRPDDPSIEVSSGFPALVEQLDESVRRPAQDAAARRAISEARYGIMQAELLAAASRSASVDSVVSEALGRGGAILAELDRTDAHWVRSVATGFSAMASRVAREADIEFERITSMSRLSVAKARLDEVVAGAVESIGRGAFDVRSGVAANLVADVQHTTQLPLGSVLASELAVPGTLWPAGTTWSAERFRDPARRFYDITGAAASRFAAQADRRSGDDVPALVGATRSVLIGQIEALAVAAANGAAVAIARRLAGFRSGVEHARLGQVSFVDPSAPPGIASNLARIEQRLFDVSDGGERHV